jgi:ribosomal protein S17E
MKFANKRVNGWNNRFVNMTKVAQALYTRQRNGFTLDWEENKFLGDYVSLKNLYKPVA